MLNERRFEDQKVFLRPVVRNDINERYLGWLNDQDVTYYLDRSEKPVEMDDLLSYWNTNNAHENMTWLAICIADDGRHIGNIRLGSIDKLHLRARVGLLIGEKEEWGKGYGTEALQLLCEIAFDKMKLNKLYAGIVEGHIGSRRVFEKVGFEVEGVLKDEVLVDGISMNSWRMGLPRRLWRGTV